MFLNISSKIPLNLILPFVTLLFQLFTQANTQDCSVNPSIQNFIQQKMQFVIYDNNTNPLQETSVNENLTLTYENNGFNKIPQIAYSINDYQCQQFTRIYYSSFVVVTQAFLTMSFYSEEMRWTIVSFNIWASTFSEIYLHSEILNYLEMANTSQVINIQLKDFKFTDSNLIVVTFLNGIRLSQNSSQKSIGILSGQIIQKKLQLTISAYSMMKIEGISFSSVILSKNNEKISYTTQMVSFANQNKQNYIKANRQFFPTKYAMLGIIGIQLQLQSMMLKLSIDLDNIITIYSQKKLRQFTITYLLVGKPTSEQCQPCKNYVYNGNQCVDSCPIGTYKYQRFKNNAKACLQCSKKIHETLNINGTDCQCQKGYALISNNSLCIKQKKIQCLPGEIFDGSKCVPSKKCAINQKLSEKNICICVDNAINFLGRCILCPQKTYKNSSLNTCRPCSLNCLTCNSSDSCNQCIDGYFWNKTQCYQICGDGKKFELQCDDNNTVDGDGCSSSCKIEAGYICEGGSPSSPDHCYKVQTLSLKLMTGYPLITVPGIVFDFELLPQLVRSQQKLYSIFNISLSQTTSFPQNINIIQNKNSLKRIRVFLNFQNQLPFVPFNISFVCQQQPYGKAQILHTINIKEQGVSDLSSVLIDK